MNVSQHQNVVKRLRQYLLERPEVLDTYVFGSFARGSEEQHSDLDVAVFVDHTAAPRSPYGYRADLTTDLMQVAERDDVDVVLLNDAPPLLYQRVLRDGIRIVSRDLGATTVREGRALSRYCDYLPQLRKVEALHAARIARGAFGR